MIRDTVENAAVYRGIHPGIDRVLKSIADGDFRRWDSGRNDIEADEIFCLIQEYRTRSEGKIEAHNRYIDIQVMIEGNERINYAERSALDSDGDFDDESDIGFFRGKGEPVYLNTGDFAVFFPGDSHAPGLTSTPGNGPSGVRKAVYKVLI